MVFLGTTSLPASELVLAMKRTLIPLAALFAALMVSPKPADAAVIVSVGPGYYAPGYYWGAGGYRYYRHPYWRGRRWWHRHWYYY